MSGIDKTEVVGDYDPVAPKPTEVTPAVIDGDDVCSGVYDGSWSDDESAVDSKTKGMVERTTMPGKMKRSR